MEKSLYVDISDDLFLSKVEVTVPTTSTFLQFLYTFFVTVHLEFELFFFSGVNDLFNSIEIEIVIVSNKRTVPSMGLGSRLHLPFWGSAIVFNYSCNYN